jgi:MFS transporter, PHS family, inorganic phosphate transporter
MVLAAMSPHQSLLKHTLMRLAIFVIAAAPGYLLAAVTIDHVGRKAIQMVGFVMMAVTFAAIAFMPDVTKLVVRFIIIYGVSYFFTEFGPNSTTFVYPAEILPVASRTTGHGIAAAGKLGAFFGVFLFPILMSWGGLTAAEAVAATVSGPGAIVTLTMLPELCVGTRLAANGSRASPRLTSDISPSITVSGDRGPRSPASTYGRRPEG